MNFASINFDSCWIFFLFLAHDVVEYTVMPRVEKLKNSWTFFNPIQDEGGGQKVANQFSPVTSTNEGISKLYLMTS